jgi:hypothetical protein
MPRLLPSIFYFLLPNFYFPSTRTLIRSAAIRALTNFAGRNVQCDWVSREAIAENSENHRLTPFLAFQTDTFSRLLSSASPGHPSSPPGYLVWRRHEFEHE